MQISVTVKLKSDDDRDPWEESATVDVATLLLPNSPEAVGRRAESLARVAAHRCLRQYDAMREHLGTAPDTQSAAAMTVDQFLDSRGQWPPRQKGAAPEDSETYRESMRDAGRGDLLR